VKRQILGWIHVSLTLATFLFILSGIGIVEHRLITYITFGFLTKDRSFLIHRLLLYPFTLSLFLHIIGTNLHLVRAHNFKNWINDLEKLKEAKPQLIEKTSDLKRTYYCAEPRTLYPYL
jgi:hypothetical protein